MSKTKNIILSGLLVLLIFSSWQVAENLINANRLANNETGLEAFIPSPSTIANTFVKSGNLIINESFYTFGKALAGFAIGVLFAILVSFLFLLIPSLRYVTLPILFGINSFPIVGLAPAVILAFGQGSSFSIIFISALICYFPTLITLDTALNNVDKDILDLMRVLNASKWQIMRYVRIPQALPFLFTAMKLAIPGSIIGATMGEWLGARNGIGQLITVALYQLKPGLLYASLILIVLICVIGILVVEFLEKYFIRWKYMN